MDERRIALDRIRYRGLPADFAPPWRVSAAGNEYVTFKGRVAVVKAVRGKYVYCVSDDGKWLSSSPFATLDGCKSAALAHLGVTAARSNECPPSSSVAVPPHRPRARRKIVL